MLDIKSFQITIIGVLALKAGVIQAPLMFPLPILTISFYFYCMRHFNTPAKHLPLHEALTPLDEGAIDAQAFMQPELKGAPLTLDNAIAEQENGNA